MLWFIIIIVAHLLNALVFVIDKYVVCSRITKPFVYAFYIGLLGVSAILLIPFGGLLMPAPINLLINLASGFVYILALIFFYHALQREEPTRVTPIIGALVIIFTLALSRFLLNERLGEQILIAIFLLIFGSALMAVKQRSRRRARSESEREINRHLVISIGLWLVASFFFALSFVLIKFTYLHQPFLSGFVWARFGGLLASLIIIAIPSARKSVFHTTKSVKKNTSLLVLGNQIMAAASFLLINFAITLKSVSIVNALQSVQYAFVLILAIALSKNHPHLLKENINHRIIFQKLVALFFIALGIYLLFL